MSPVADATDVKPNTPVTVTATSGVLRSVAVTPADGGAAVSGAVVKGRWVSTGNLAPSTRYTVTTTAAGGDGKPVQSTSSFRTLDPAVVATYHVIYDGQTVGVGAPVTIQFDSPVATKAMRADIEKHATVTASPTVAGSWGWLDNRQLMWRPATFWKPGTKVSLAANLQGLQTGDGKWIGKSTSSTMTIGSAVISTVDIANHTMTVTQNGKTIRTMPISAGKGTEERFVTRSGTKVIIEKVGDLVMDSESVGIKKGDKDYYKLDTKFNLRVTWTGEFLHSAPWSVGAQGVENVSHGCTNLGPQDAQWMFNESKVGDVVKFVGSNRPFEPTDGIGVWTYTYPQWQKQSALA